MASNDSVRLRLDGSDLLRVRPVALAVLALAVGGSLSAQVELFRSVDGRGNNRMHRDWGAAGEALVRLTRADYADGRDAPSGALRPGARAISNAVAAQSGAIDNRRRASGFLWQWGQFLDHDIGLTEGAEPHESFDVLVPIGDPWFDPFSTGAATIPVSRSVWTRDRAGVRQQVNDNTAFIDASQVYGSDVARAAALRAPFGRMAVSDGNLLPFNTAGFANAPSASLPEFFLAGDVRANEQIGLIALHTVFVREHNWIVDQLEPLGLTSDALYEVARALVGAEMQVITYGEFLPVLLGPDALRPYRGYRSDVDPQLANVFSSAVFRLGHTLLPSELLRLDAEMQPVAEGALPLRDAFFAPELVVADGIDAVLRGLAVQPSQELDRFVVDDVRNFLFGQPGQGGFDLASLNVQRGRDHGLPSFNGLRRAFGLRHLQGFQELTDDRATRVALASVYGSIEQLDPWVGGLSEDHARGAMVGRTFRRVLADQFERLRDGDRFWYRAHLPAALVAWVEAQTLAAILRRNTGLGAEIPDRVFELSPAGAR